MKIQIVGLVENEAEAIELTLVAKLMVVGETARKLGRESRSTMSRMQ